MSKRGLYETALAIGDYHAPFGDPFALAGVMEFAKDLQPDVIFFMGDMVDFADISYFSQNPLRTLSMNEQQQIAKSIKRNGKDIILQAAMQREFDEVYRLLVKMRNILPNTRMIYIYGNHEYRLHRFLCEKAPELVGLRRAEQQKESPILSVEYLLRFKELEIEKCFSEQRESYFQWGRYLILGHFDTVRKHSGWTARGLVDEKNISLIQAHTHRMGSYHKTTFGGHQLVGHENGCLCSLKPEYKKDPNWQQGFTVVHKKRNGSRFHIQPIPIVDYKFFYGDIEYNGKPLIKIKRKSFIPPSSVRSKESSHGRLTPTKGNKK